EMIKALTWLNAGLIMACCIVSERLQGMNECASFQLKPFKHGAAQDGVPADVVERGHDDVTRPGTLQRFDQLTKGALIAEPELMKQHSKAVTFDVGVGRQGLLSASYYLIRPFDIDPHIAVEQRLHGHSPVHFWMAEPRPE